MRISSNTFFIALFSLSAFCNAQSQLQAMQSSVRKILLSGEGVGTMAVPQSVEENLKTMQGNGSWPDQVYTDTDRDHWKAKDHLSRLERIAQQFYSHGDVPVDVRDRIVASLKYWLDTDPHNTNWWWNEISIPRSVGTILIILGDDAPPELKQRGIELMKRANWTKQTGANLLDETWIQVMRGCLSDSLPTIEEAFTRTWQEIKIVDTRQEGIQADGSFHQHGPLLYNESYGSVMLDASLHFLSVAKGTAYEPPATVTDALNRLVLDGDLWMSRNWTWDWGTCGRAICRKHATVSSLQAALDQLSPDKQSPPVGNRYFWCSDYMVQRSADAFASIRMYSTRTANTDELTNGENQKSHHIADGATCLMVSGKEYLDIYPVWDWRRIPGTTIEQDVPLSPKGIKRIGKADFVGGVSDHGFGCAAMDLVYDKLHAYKSWFCFEDEIVCLGAGIDCGNDHPVLTTLNQCLLNGDVRTAGETNALSPGEHYLQNAKWIWHDSIGYILPEPANVELKLGPQTGAWSDIGVGSTDRISRDVFNAVISHGNHPTGETYQYILLIGATLDRTVELSTKPDLRILSNTARLQAVWNQQRGLLQAIFTEPGEIHAPDFTVRVDQPCRLMLQRGADGTRLSVSSPSHSAKLINVFYGGSAIHVDLDSGYADGQTWSRDIKSSDK